LTQVDALHYHVKWYLDSPGSPGTTELPWEAGDMRQLKPS
jgi:hypothetical protein